MALPSQFVQGHRRWAELSDDDAGRAVREPRGVGERGPGGNGEGERADHGVAGARDVGDLARFGG